MTAFTRERNCFRSARADLDGVTQRREVHAPLEIDHQDRRVPHGDDAVTLARDCPGALD